MDIPRDLAQVFSGLFWGLGPGPLGASGGGQWLGPLGAGGSGPGPLEARGGQWPQPPGARGGGLRRWAEGPAGPVPKCRRELLLGPFLVILSHLGPFWPFFDPFWPFGWGQRLQVGPDPPKVGVKWGVESK